MSYASKTIATNLALSKLGQDRLQISDFDSDNTIAGVQARLHYDPALEELTRMHTWSCCKKRSQIGPFKINITTGSNLQGDGAFNGDLTASSTDSNNFPIYTSTETTATAEGYAKVERAVTGTGAKVWQVSLGLGSSTTTTTLENTNYSPAGDYNGGSSAGFGLTISIVAPDFEYDYSFRIPSDAQRSVYTTDQSSSYRYAKSNFAWKREGNAILTDFSPLYICYEAIPNTTDFDPLFGNAFTSYLAYKLAMPVTGDKELALLLIKEFQEIVLPEARRINGFERNESPNIDSEWLEATYTSASSSITSYPPFSLSSYGTFE